MTSNRDLSEQKLPSKLVIVLPDSGVLVSFYAKTQRINMLYASRVEFGSNDGTGLGGLQK